MASFVVKRSLSFGGGYKDALVSRGTMSDILDHFPLLATYFSGALLFHFFYMRDPQLPFTKLPNPCPQPSSRVFLRPASFSFHHGHLPAHPDQLLMGFKFSLLQNTALATSLIPSSRLCDPCPQSSSSLQHSASFARCLDLRDKYLELSLQRLGDNPRDHDGTFQGFYPKSASDINGLKPDGNLKTCEDPGIASPGSSTETSLPAWKIYPPPPPPHWHWKPAENGVKPDLAGMDSETGESGAGPSSANRDGQIFKFIDCSIPGESSRRCDFALNDEGVYEVWDMNDFTLDRKGKRPITRVPSLKEYFTDLDYLLGVCSDGPAKSFAFRRLKYLASKWSLFCLLNEYQELADMKVSTE